MAQPNRLANINSLCGAVLGDDDVLLVSFGHHQQTVVVRLCSPFWAEHILEHHLALEIVSLVD